LCQNSWIWITNGARKLSARAQCCRVQESDLTERTANCDEIWTRCCTLEKKTASWWNFNEFAHAMQIRQHSADSYTVPSGWIMGSSASVSCQVELQWTVSSPGLLGFDAVLCCGRIPTFHNSVLPPSSRWSYRDGKRSGVDIGLPTSSWRWTQLGSPKRLYPTLHGVTTQKTWAWNITAMEASEVIRLNSNCRLLCVSSCLLKERVCVCVTKFILKNRPLQAFRCLNMWILLFQ
jgi:hypothetical protein